MRICLDVRYRMESGASSYIRNIVPELLKQGKEHSFILLKYSDQSFDFEAQAGGVITCPVENKVLMLLWDMLILPQKLRCRRTDIYHPLKSPGPVWITCRKVYTMHSITHDYKGHFPTSPMRYLYDILYTNHFIRHADRLIAVSDFISDFLTDSFGIARRNIDIVYHGTSSLFRPISGEQVRNVLQKYSLPENYLLSVGNITPVKNHLAAVRAFARIADRFPVNLVLVGGKENPYCRKVEAEIVRQNLSERVFLPGFISGSDLAAVMSGARAMIIPSLTEGFGFVMLEAFGCGLPVIASKRGGLWDVGKSCALFVEDPEDDAGFAGQISRLLSSEDLRESLARKSVQRAAELRWENAAILHLKTYQQCGLE